MMHGQKNIKLCHLYVLIVLQFGSLTFLEPSGPVQGLLYLYMVLYLSQDLFKPNM
jgi:hypothetical protein